MPVQTQKNKIKEIAEGFFSKMTMIPVGMEIDFSASDGFSEIEKLENEAREVVSLNVKMEEPQVLIGQGGQTLSEIQRLLRLVLKKNLKEEFLFNLDINDYKKKKAEYLKDLAVSMADQVVLTREEKILTPMSSYERRIIHAELSEREDIKTESQGVGFDRHIVIRPK